MDTALLLTDAEPETRGLLERRLPRDGFALVTPKERPDLVLAGDVEAVDLWVDRAPVIVLGREPAGTVDCVHAFRRGCDDYVAPPLDYLELVGAVSVISHSPVSEKRLAQAVCWPPSSTTNTPIRPCYGRNWRNCPARRAPRTTGRGLRPIPSSWI